MAGFRQQNEGGRRLRPIASYRFRFGERFLGTVL